MADPDKMQERLDEVGRDIDAAREQAEDDDLLPEDEAEEREPTLSDPAPGRPERPSGREAAPPA